MIRTILAGAAVAGLALSLSAPAATAQGVVTDADVTACIAGNTARCDGVQVGARVVPADRGGAGVTRAMIRACMNYYGGAPGGYRLQTGFANGQDFARLAPGGAITPEFAARVNSCAALQASANPGSSVRRTTINGRPAVIETERTGTGLVVTEGVVSGGSLNAATGTEIEEARRSRRGLFGTGLFRRGILGQKYPYRNSDNPLSGGTGYLIKDETPLRTRAEWLRSK